MRALIFDTETTGLVDNVTIADKHLPDIIEFYGCVANLTNGEIDKEFHTLVKPRKPIEEEITKITGLTDEKLKDAPYWQSIMINVIDLIDQSQLAIAHNASFDKEMVDLECGRCDTKLFWPTVLCTVEQTIHLKGFRLSLSALHEHLFGEPFADAHRAKNDTQALLRCCVELYKRELI
jgi:DNA polymerase-3 subunit alpha (Gram-positive type)